MSTQPEQSPEAIEGQIEETRHQLSNTLQELQNRLSPGDVFEDTLNYLKTNTELRRRVTTTIRDNPIPVCLIGIGVIWLVVNGASVPRRRANAAARSEDWFDAAPSAGDPRFSDHPEGPSPQPYPSGAESDSSGKGRATSKVEDAKVAASHAADSVKKKL